MSDTNLDASNPVDWTGNPKKLQVAVVIAMPRPPADGERSSSSLGASTSAAPAAACPLDDEPEIPIVEFGVAILDVQLPEPVPQSEKDKLEHRASASGSSDV